MESTTYENLVKSMQQHAEQENPKECCGVITTDFPQNGLKVSNIGDLDV